MKIQTPENDRGHGYGFITKKEAALIDATLADIQYQFAIIRFLEIGVFGGGTLYGVINRADELQCPIITEGVDFAAWKPSLAPPQYVFHEGDSMDQWRNVLGPVNFLFVDGCHCINHAMCDFLNYSPFVDVGGYCLFHDTAPNANGEQGDWPQDHSYAGKPPSKLGVREGLKKLGLLGGHRDDWKLVAEIQETELMGMCLFQKIKAL